MRPMAGVLGAALLAGCGLVGGTPQWVTDRIPLPLCGTEEGRELDVRARTCVLRAAEEGREGELISRLTSVEGDEVVRYTRVHANGVIEIFHDATRDRFGSGEWERLTCDRLVPDAQFVFVEEGCQHHPVP